MAVKKYPPASRASDLGDLIHTVRGQKVILDADLAAIYGVTTKRLNEQVKRNASRFPNDFMFRLSRQEKTEVVANCDHLSRLKFSPSLPSTYQSSRLLQPSAFSLQPFSDIPGFSMSASLDEIRKHNHVLTPGRYVGAAEEEEDAEPFEKKMKRLTAELEQQFAESGKLEKAIRANLKELQYGGH